MPDGITAYEHVQPWGHGPIRLCDWRTTQAVCTGCGWRGPDRTGDPHAYGLVVDDAMWHCDVVGARL